ncbi:MAG: type II toxin-antitoxin system RelE/ParE family toxin [Thermoleophilia bacterium]
MVYDHDAVRELHQVRDKRLRSAIFTAVDKLRILGPKTIEPHSKKIQGANKLRELRPRGGQCTVRPLYVQRNEREYVILAIAPEAVENSSGSTHRSSARGPAPGSATGSTRERRPQVDALPGR